MANRQETQKPQYVSDSHEYQELQSLKISSQGVFIPKIVQYRLSDHLINIEGVYKKTWLDWLRIRRLGGSSPSKRTQDSPKLRDPKPQKSDQVRQKQFSSEGLPAARVLEI